MTLLNTNHIIVFTRYPQPGKTKTRLIPALGGVGAAEFHRRMVERTLNTVRQYAKRNKAGIEVCHTGGNEKKLKTWLGKDLYISRQISGDMGQRMKYAFEHAFAKGARKVILMGTDIPHISITAIREAFDALSRHDVVVGPSTDGGYWLMGLTRGQDIFANITWSTSEVLPRTLDISKQKNLSVYQLEPLVDIDTVEDLKAVLPGEFECRPYVSVVIPTLNEEENITSAIMSATHASAQIIVVDGGSRDTTVQKASALGAKVIKSPKGRAIQQNCGARHAQGDVLLFLHADTTLPVAYVEKIFEALLDAKTVTGAFQFKTSQNTSLMRFFEKITNIRSKVFNRPYGDQCLFLRKAVFDHVGGFPSAPVAEDLMLIRQLGKLGKIKIVNTSAITSSRRWENIGVWKTFFINQLVVLGYALGISPDTLAGLYQKADQNLRRKNIGVYHDKL